VRLAASLVVRNELDRYLKPCIAHLLEFVDLIVILDDASDDGTREWLSERDDERIVVEQQYESTFYRHEGRTRQLLVDVVLEQSPTHVISLDGDELISNDGALRARIEAEPDVPVWSLMMEEVWRADADALWIRQDGGWRAHPLPVLWRAPQNGERFTMLDKKLACRRVPMEVLAQRAKPSGMSVLHFGWTDKATRQARYDRYAKHDGGKFHASSHLRSILWDDARVKLQRRDWPEGEVFDPLRERVAAVTA
jgi:glycosyltransferase involved in cell wall biosynthesis